MDKNSKLQAEWLTITVLPDVLIGTIKKENLWILLTDAQKPTDGRHKKAIKMNNIFRSKMILV
ncbi:hypothetical protein [Cellulosilyticum sp. I15G10I2]|uniref:hypothetical protein n=1 Tax=Cellulosilyticum sp. I15G10I2 TaxID=1892843 RepID=UPI00085C8CCF|nr:hypothetical protein [Cellulosilyticum sp. I15G10I2]